MNKQEEAKLADDDEALYHSVLGLLDALPDYESRCIVVINWAKYVMLTRAEVMKPGLDIATLNAFRKLCIEFAGHIISLPDIMVESLNGHAPCGRCKQCIAEGVKPPADESPVNEPVVVVIKVVERPTEPTVKGEQAN